MILERRCLPADVSYSRAMFMHSDAVEHLTVPLAPGHEKKRESMTYMLGVIRVSDMMQEYRDEILEKCLSIQLLIPQIRGSEQIVGPKKVTIDWHLTIELIQDVLRDAGADVIQESHPEIHMMEARKFLRNPRD